MFPLREDGSIAPDLRFDVERGRARADANPVLVALASFTGNSRAAEIEVIRSGRFVYASNRGHDSIARVCGRRRERSAEPARLVRDERQDTPILHPVGIPFVAC